MAQDQEIQAISYTLQILEEQANMLNERQGYYLETLQGLQITQVTIDELEHLPDNHEIILPIGNRAFLKAKVQEPSKILVAIGRDVILEKTLPDAREYTRKMMDEIKDAQTKTKDQLSQVLKKMDELKGALNQKMGSGSAGEEFPSGFTM
ncbi:MAG: prefoldin subunit alpha [Promethearchaeota archaeon CR_4]|nr:MAG: prefoldin subunit alpha [Candidatus Lokiarchaeota archaeon CR_4]